MTYTSNSPFPPPGSPEAKLADKNWRWLNSWWIFAPVIGCGFFGFIGFLVAAIRTRQRHYWISTAVYAFLGFLAITLISLAGEEGSPNYDLLSNLAMAPFLAAFFAPIIHAAVKNRDYLTTIAHKGQWYATSPPPPPPPPTSPPNAPFLGISNDDYFAPGQAAAGPGRSLAKQPGQSAETSPRPPQAAPPSATSTPRSSSTLDINRATAHELVNELRIDDSLAAHVIAARNTRGGFQDINDLAAAAGLQPHQLVRFRNKVTFGRSQGPQQPPSGPTGRILDY